MIMSLLLSGIALTATADERMQEIERMDQGLPPRGNGGRTQIPAIDTFAVTVHVAPAGDDASGDGSAAKPFATLARARDEVRAIKKRGEVKGAIGVLVAPGEYRTSQTLTLTKADSGSDGAPVVYRSTEPGKAVLYGGTRLTGFTPVTDPVILARLPEEARGHVRQCDLKALGVNDYGELTVRGFGQKPSPPTLELFFDGRPMTLARWPNQGYVDIRELVNPGSPQDGTPAVIGYEDARHERWLQAEDPWLFGYFRFLWADATIKIAAIDPAARTLTTAEPYAYSNGGMSTEQGIIYYAFNLLEELDLPGEWYLDRRAGILYFYPPADMAAATVEIGILSEPMIAMEEVSHLRFEGMVLDLARGDAIRATKCHDILFAGCTVKRMAGNGIMIHGGNRNGLFGCDIHTIGRRATEIIGGDRATLTPGNHFVENCRIHAFGRIDRTYTPGVQLEGVGNRVAYNLMYDAPSSVMRLEGNDHVFEFNEVHSAVTESDDQGAIDIFANPTYRGNVFRHNYFHNVGKAGKEPARHGQAGIRFDDAISGQLVYGNIFVRSSNGNFGAVQMNSGRDNIIVNNIFYDCKFGVSGGWYPGNSVWTGMREGTRKVDHRASPLYLSRYPAMAQMLDDNGINHFWRNIAFDCGRMRRDARRDLELRDNAEFSADSDPVFVDAAAGDFRLRPGAPPLDTSKFRPIPMDQIGLYAHAFRASWPVTTVPVTLPDWRSALDQESKPISHPMAPVTAPKVTTTPSLADAQNVAFADWPGLALAIQETPNRKPIDGQGPVAKVAHDGVNLFVVVRVPQDTKTLRRGTTWGQDDGMEICLREEGMLAVGRRPPTFVFQGFTEGTRHGAPIPDEIIADATVRQAGEAVGYRATVADAGDAWTGAWTIPFAALNIAYQPGKRLQFNIGVRRTSPDGGGWIALAGAMGANFLLDNSAVLILE
jgi:hypothetical protein